MRRLFLLALLAACGGAPRSATPAPDSQSMTAAQLDAVSSANLLEALRNARPVWFGYRGIQSVFVEDQWYGGPGVLVFFRANEIGLVKRLSESETTGRFGTVHPGPSVAIYFRRGK